MSLRSACVPHLTMLVLIGSFPFPGQVANQDNSPDACASPPGSQTYSNAVYLTEAGDVVGYELVLTHQDSNSVKAFLYIYEGEANQHGISLSGKASSGRLRMEGEWILPLSEQPSGKQIVETRRVEVSGILESTRFRGTIKISGGADTVTLKRVGQIWRCRPSSSER